MRTTSHILHTSCSGLNSTIWRGKFNVTSELKVKLCVIEEKTFTFRQLANRNSMQNNRAVEGARARARPKGGKSCGNNAHKT